MTDNAMLLAELVRVKAFFQLRAICTALEIPTATASPDSRVSAPGASPTVRTGGTLAQPHENSIHQHIKSDSFVHGEDN